MNAQRASSDSVGLPKSSRGEQLIIQAFEQFMRSSSGKGVGFLESILFEWYQHYAIGQHSQGHISDVINETFLINDLLLNLEKARNAMEAEEVKAAVEAGSDSLSFKVAS